MEELRIDTIKKAYRYLDWAATVLSDLGYSEEWEQVWSASNRLGEEIEKREIAALSDTE